MAARLEVRPGVRMRAVMRVMRAVFLGAIWEVTRQQWVNTMGVVLFRILSFIIRIRQEEFIILYCYQQCLEHPVYLTLLLLGIAIDFIAISKNEDHVVFC